MCLYLARTRALPQDRLNILGAPHISGYRKTSVVQANPPQISRRLLVCTRCRDSPATESARQLNPLPLCSARLSIDNPDRLPAD